MTVIINESGLYSLILMGETPEAKRFKKWVTSEVLPAIRKTGRYEGQMPLPRPIADTFRRIEARQGVDAAPAKVVELFPTADARDHSANIGDNISILDAAKTGEPNPLPGLPGPRTS